jgi:hypothetical protein
MGTPVSESDVERLDEARKAVGPVATIDLHFQGIYRRFNPPFLSRDLGPWRLSVYANGSTRPVASMSAQPH